MVRDYTLTSPNLDGILTHESVAYGGLKRPVLINRIFDKPSGSKAVDMNRPENRKIIEHYFHDLYEVLMKRLAEFAMKSNPDEDESVKLMAMLQELFKVKKLLILRKIT